MKFGPPLPTLTGFPRETGPRGRDWRTRWARSFEIVVLAEDLGFERGTVGHHRFTTERIASSQPMFAIAALAARTTTLRVLTNILIPPSRDPIGIAEQVAMVDEPSDGRVMLASRSAIGPTSSSSSGSCSRNGSAASRRASPCCEALGATNRSRSKASISPLWART